MKNAITNLGSCAWARSAALLLPAILSVFALAGVTAGPVLGIAETSLELRAAERRADALQTERGRLDRFLAAGGFERAAQAVERARAFVPAEGGAVRAYGFVRLAAERLGLELERLELGPVVDLGLEGPDDRLVAQVVRLAGEATLSELVALVETLRGLGWPTTVRDVSVRRESPTAARFHFLITLGLLHTAPPELPLEEVGS